MNSGFTRGQSRAGRRRGQYRTLLFVIGGVLIICALIFHQFIGSTVRGMLASFSSSKIEVYEALPKNVLASRLQDAEEELSRTRYLSVLYAYEVERSHLIEESLGLPSTVVSSRGRIIARPPRTHYDTLLVALSNTHTVSVGDAAYVDGILVGDVISVDDSTALVSLFSTPGRSFDVSLGDPTAIVVMRGLGGGAFLFEIPKTVSVSAGDAVLYAQGSESPIAFVQYIIDEPEKTTLTVHAASPVSLMDSHVVEFVKITRKQNAL